MKSSSKLTANLLKKACHRLLAVASLYKEIDNITKKRDFALGFFITDAQANR